MALTAAQPNLNHSGGHSVALGIVSMQSASWDLRALQFLAGDNSTLNEFNEQERHNVSIYAWAVISVNLVGI